MASKRPSLKTKKPKERWLLTRKTWRYMTDAGRRLIPEGTTNKEEDLPIIESHFQEVCRRENRFLLWRKCSYPSALKHSRFTGRNKHNKGLKSRAGSATELELSTACSRLRGENKGRNSLPGVPKGWLSAHRFIKSSQVKTGHVVDWSGDAEAVFETEEDEYEEGVSESQDIRSSARQASRGSQFRRGGSRSESSGRGSRSSGRRVAGETGELEPGVDANDENDFHSGGNEQQKSDSKSKSHLSYDSAYGGVKKKLSHFWKGSSDARKQSNLKASKSSGSEESVNKIDWHHNLKSATSESDFNEAYETELSKIRLRKVNSDENTDQSTHIRYGVGNLPRNQANWRDGLKLRHIENEKNSNYERSAENRIPLLKYSQDGRDYFDEEAESSWSLDRSTYQDKIHSQQGRHDTNYNISGSTERIPSRHNLTLPGLNISRPAKSSNETSAYTLPQSSSTQRNRRSGNHDFYAFQSHLSNWKTTNTTESNKNTTNFETSHQQQQSLQQQQQSQQSISKPAIIKSSNKIPGCKFYEQGTQTLPISEAVMRVIESELQNIESATVSPQPSPTPPKINKPPQQTPPVSRRKSSIESIRSPSTVTDDCSPSVGDKLLRYLKMARKKSSDADKADRFKTVNYDRTLRYIKSKTPIEDENIKNIQTDESWLKLSADPNLFDEYNITSPNNDDLHFFSSDHESSDLGFASSSHAASSRSSFDAGELVISVPTNLTSPQSPTANSPSSGHSFLAQLLHGLQQAAGNPHMSLPTAMQKSKSSSSVGHPRLMAKKIWRTRSKSQSRATPSTTSTWTPQGQCRWTSVTGRSVQLQSMSLLHLTDLERRVLQQVALAKLQALNLGVNIRIPSEDTVPVTTKPKKRPYLLKRKALTTGFFDSGRKDTDSNKEKEGSSGLVFGIPLAQCIANDRLSEEARIAASGSDAAELRRRSHHGSRTSFSSLGDTAAQGGSCESLPAVRPGVAGSVPGLLDVLSAMGGGDGETEGIPWSPSVPHVVATCCRHIMQHGLRTLGIFRVSSSKKRVRQLREDFDSGRDTDMGSELCPHDAATLLKEFFRDLPEPLMLRELYPAFVHTQRIRNRRLQSEALQHLVQLLPVPNRDTLAALLAFLHTVAENSEDGKDSSGEVVQGNKMDSINLATLFAPNILHSFRPGSGAKEAAAERAEDRTDAINVIRSLIDRHSDVFEVSAELLDEVYLHMMDSHPDALDQLLRKLCFGGDDMPDDGDNNSVFEGSESSSVPRTPTEGPATPITASVDDKESSRGWSESGGGGGGRKVWSREEFLHETAGMGGPDVGMSPRHRGRERSKKRGKEDSTNEPGTTTSSSRWFGHQSSKKREKSSSDDVVRRRSERGSSSSMGITSEPATPVTSPPTSYTTSRSPSVDESQASTIIAATERSRENIGSGNVITASLKIPMPASSSFALSLDDIPFIEDDRVTTLGRRSVDSAHTSRPSTDSAIGSTISPAPGSEAPISGLSSPPSIPATPTPGDESPNNEDGVTTTGRILIPAMSSAKLTTTLVRKVEVTTKSTPTEVPIERRPSAKIIKEDKKKYTRRRYTDSRHPTVQFPDVEALESAAATAVRPEASTKPSQVWKRRELIASDPKEHETFV